MCKDVRLVQGAAGVFAQGADAGRRTSRKFDRIVKKCGRVSVAGYGISVYFRGLPDTDVPFPQTGV